MKGKPAYSSSRWRGAPDAAALSGAWRCSPSSSPPSSPMPPKLLKSPELDMAARCGRYLSVKAWARRPAGRC